MSALRFRLHAVSVLAPGLNSLSDLMQLRAGLLNVDYQLALNLPKPHRLPPNEQRRAPQVVRLTMECIEQLAATGHDVSSLRSVFVTDDGVGEISTQMLEAINTTQQVSPLVFPSSVHGVAAGYFAIAFQNRKASTTISQGADSFAAGLLTAVIEAIALNESILLVAYDAPMLTPMSEVLPIVSPTATAWIISPDLTRPKGLGKFQLFVDDEPNAELSDLPTWLPNSWLANSSVQAFAVLDLLYASSEVSYRMRLGGGSLVIKQVN